MLVLKEDFKSYPLMNLFAYQFVDGLVSHPGQRDCGRIGAP